MKRGDKVRVVHRDGTVETGHVHMAGTALVHVRHDDGALSYYSPRALGAMRSVLDAAEAVARERREVVEAAKAWDGVHATTSGFHALEHLRDRLILLREAERVEAEARAKLEALR